MTVTSSKTLFFITLTLGATIAASSSSWFMAWMGLELNLLSFLPLISSKTNMYSSEAALKYFLVQALGSAFIMSATPLNLLSPNYLYPAAIISSALLMKMGAAPFHFWFPSVMQGISWPMCLLLMTIQKMAPMLLLSHTITNSFSLTNLVQMIVMTSSILSSITGSLGGLNQTLTRMIMAYSSINHMSWMLAAMVLGKSIWSYYFLIYFTISSSVVMLLYTNQIYHFNQITLIHPKMSTKLFLFMSLLSLGGLPPFLGFLPKMLVIKEMISTFQVIWLIFLLSGALLVLFFYLRIISLSLFLSSTTMKTQLTKPSKTTLTLLTFINLLPMFSPYFTIIPF